MAFEHQISEYSGFKKFVWIGNLLEKNQIDTALQSAQQFVELGQNKWMVDLSQLQHLNSSGLNALIQLLTKARNAGGEAVLFGLNQRTKDLLTMTKLHSIFAVVPSLEDAVEILSSK